MPRAARIWMAVVSLVLVGAISSGAQAATSPWAASANKVCTAWKQKAAAVFGANPQQPKTAKALYAFVLAARPIEVGELRALRRITLPRPAGAPKALSLAAADIHEIDAAIAAYRAGNQSAFLNEALAWLTDHRAGRAFTAVGATACA